MLPEPTICGDCALEPIYFFGINRCRRCVRAKLKIKVLPQ